MCVFMLMIKKDCITLAYVYAWKIFIIIIVELKNGDWNLIISFRIEMYYIISDVRIMLVTYNTNI